MTELINGLKRAKAIALNEHVNLAMERFHWISDSEDHKALAYEQAGVRKVIQAIEKEIQKKTPEGAKLLTYSLPEPNEFIKQLNAVNEFLSQHTVHDDLNWDHRISEITYNKYGNDELIAMFEPIPYPTDPKEHKGEL